jgi:hypothetical protein
LKRSSLSFSLCCWLRLILLDHHRRSSRRRCSFVISFKVNSFVVIIMGDSCDRVAALGLFMYAKRIFNANNVGAFWNAIYALKTCNSVLLSCRPDLRSLMNKGLSRKSETTIYTIHLQYCIILKTYLFTFTSNQQCCASLVCVPPSSKMSRDSTVT